MGRFSPTVLPNSGEVLSRALGQGVDSFLRARRQRDEDQRQAKADERQSVLDTEGTRHNQAMEGMAAFQHGFVKDDMKGIDRRTALTGGQVNDAMSVATGGVTGPALATALGRPAVQTNRYGPSVGGYSYDEESDVAQNARVARALSVSQTNRNNRPPEQRPTAQGHVVDPVTGEVKFFDPTHPPSGLRVNPAPRPASYTPVTMGGDDGTPAVVRPFNNRTGEVGSSIGPAKPAAATTGRAVRISTQFDSDPIIKNAKDIVQGLAKVRASAQDPSAAGDLALLYGYNKILDPGSVVRETEFATAAKSGSLPQQIQAAALRVANGQRLTPEQRADFIQRAEGIAGAQQKLARETGARYTERAKRLGIDPRDVVYDPFDETLSGSPPAKPATASDPESEWAKKNPPHKGESFEQYHARFLQGGH